MRLGSLLMTVCLASLFQAAAASAQDADIGAELFADSCAACHGASEKGDGDMAGVMTIAAPDITGLAERNVGVFPMLQVLHIIDGLSGVRAHGRPMPVFGRIFSAERDGYEAVLTARGRILSLALYLESIQK